MMWHDGWWWGMGFHWIFMILFWVLVIWGAYALIRWVAERGGRGEAAGDRALELLRERYARGEIDREEYEARRRDLERA